MDVPYQWVILSINKTTSGVSYKELQCPICKNRTKIVSGEPDRCFICGIPLKLPNLI
jgi:hypothetical protein